MKKEKKILLFIHNLNGGGAEKVFSYIANDLYDAGYDMSLVLVQKKGVFLNNLNPGMHVVDLKARGTFLSTLKLLSHTRSLKKDYERVIILSTLVSANIVNVWTRLLLGNRITSLIREANNPITEAKIASWHHKIIYTIGRVFYKYSNLLIGVSDGVTLDSERYYHLKADRSTTIYNPAFPDEYRRLAEIDSIAEKLDHNHQIIMAMGRVVPQKGFDTLLHAYAEVSSELPDTRLIILGKRDYVPDFTKMLDQLVEKLGLMQKVMFLGFKENPFPYMKRANLFVLSSRYEGMPSSLIQAISLGTPVVSTDCPSGPYEILSGGKYGALVPVEDTRALAQAMIKSLKNDHNQKLSAQFVDTFGSEKAFNAYRKLLD